MSKHESKLELLLSLLDVLFAERSSQIANNSQSSSASSCTDLIRLFLSTLFFANHLFISNSIKKSSVIEQVLESPDKFIRQVIDRNSKNTTFEAIYQTLYFPQFNGEYKACLLPRVQSLQYNSSDQIVLEDICTQKVQIFVQDNIEALKKKIEAEIKKCSSAAILVELEDLCFKLLGDSFQDLLYVVFTRVDQLNF